MPIFINETISLPDEELSWSYSRSGGPGGQNVNKVASKVQLRWEIDANATVPEQVKLRLRTQNPSNLTSDGGFLIVAQESRDQLRNKEIAIEKMIDLIRVSLIEPKKRTKTKPSKSSKLRRLNDKKIESSRKANRKVSHGD